MKRRSPHIPIRPHTYVPDLNDPGDWQGKRRCAGCSMPKGSRVHDYTPPADESARILGKDS